MKKVLAWLLVLMMVMVCVACATEKPAADTESEQPSVQDPADAALDVSEWPVVSVDALSFTDSLSRTKDVEAALNEYLVSINAGVQAEIIVGTWNDRNSNLTLLLADKDNPIDLFCWRFYSTVDALVKNDQIINLDSYREIYPELWEAYPSVIYKTCQVDGQQYSIPGADSFGNMTGYMLRKSVADAIGVSDMDGQEITMEQLREIQTQAEQAFPDQAWWSDMRQPVSLMGIDNLGDPYWLGVLMNRGVGETEIINYYASEEFKAWCEDMKWYNDNGMVPNDPLNTVPAGNLYGDGLVSGQFCDGYSLDYIRSLMASQVSGEFVVFKLNDYVGTNSCVYNGWCVSSLCKNPDAAMKLLDLMMTDENVCRFFTLGIENVTYKINEHGTASYADGVDDTTAGWNLSAPWFYPNECLSIPFNTDNVNYFSDLQACWTDESAQFSDAMGFMFDNTNVYDKQKACQMVVDQYRDSLLYGLVDVDVYLTKFNEELVEAGINDVIAEMNTQYQAFLASK